MSLRTPVPLTARSRTATLARRILSRTCRWVVEALMCQLEGGVHLTELEKDVRSTETAWSRAKLDAFCWNGRLALVDSARPSPSRSHRRKLNLPMGRRDGRTLPNRKLGRSALPSQFEGISRRASILCALPSSLRPPRESANESSWAVRSTLAFRLSRSTHSRSPPCSPFARSDDC